jgi:CRP-like cAMP-binding protein
MEKLFKILLSLGKMSPALIAHLQKKLKPFNYKKGEHILKIGDTANLILFIEEGLVLSYYNVGEKQVSNWFMGKGEIFISVLSFHRRIPSVDAHIALTDCKCLGITCDELEEAFELFPEFERHGRKLEAEYYCLAEERQIMLKRQPKEAKFKALMAQYPDLPQYATHEQMASYLDMGLRTFDYLWQKYLGGELEQ